MKNDEVTPKKLKVETPLGTLVAEPTGDPEYPGFWISIVDSEENEKTLALVETKRLNNEEDYIRLLAYTDLGNEDYTHELFFIEKYEIPKRRTITKMKLKCLQ